MEEIKNVIVEQTDIYDIIRAFNDYYVKQKQEFDETDRLVEEEEAKYRQWNDARFNSASFENYPAFNRQTFKNKRTSAKLSIDTSYVDGSTVEGRTVEDFYNSIANIGFDKIDAITISMNVSYYAEYKADDYSSNPQNRISQDVFLKFRQDSIYYSVSGENCPAIVTELKHIILDKFEKLEPRLSPLITKRKKIKYASTLSVSFIISAILMCGAMFVADKYLSMIDWSTYKFSFIPAFVIVALFLNTLMPAFKLSSLYSLIIPKQSKEYSSYDRSFHNVDNIKDYVSVPEIQIGANAKKAGVRKKIKDIIQNSKKKNIIAFILGFVAVTAFALLMI